VCKLDPPKAAARAVEIKGAVEARPAVKEAVKAVEIKVAEAAKVAEIKAEEVRISNRFLPISHHGPFS